MKTALNLDINLGSIAILLILNLLTGEHGMYFHLFRSSLISFNDILLLQCSDLHLFCFFFKLIYFNWRLITLQYCSGFCHTLT